MWVIRYWNSKKFIKLKINLKRDLITYVLLAAQSIVLLLEDGIVLYGVEIGMFFGDCNIVCGRFNVNC